ncbi:MAG: GNAT family N-acetyltransferase, partial [Dietzia sp.]|nr:GNAT family N-acetyltransferase [Dietzia sp.]
MTDLPAPGTRVSLRYRLPAGSTPPHTDVVGHLVELAPLVRVRTRHGDVVDVAPGDVLAVRVVPEMPVRTGDIRNLEHAAALG